MAFLSPWPGDLSSFGKPWWFQAAFLVYPKGRLRLYWFPCQIDTLSKAAHPWPPWISLYDLAATCKALWGWLWDASTKLVFLSMHPTVKIMWFLCCRPSLDSGVSNQPPGIYARLSHFCCWVAVLAVQPLHTAFLWCFAAGTPWFTSASWGIWLPAMHPTSLQANGNFGLPLPGEQTKLRVWELSSMTLAAAGYRSGN